MIKEIISKYDAGRIEKKVMQFWEDSDAYLKTRELRKIGRKFFFVDEPPVYYRAYTSWNCLEQDHQRFYSSLLFHEQPLHP